MLPVPISFSEVLPIILVICCVYLGYTIYASVKYKKNFFPPLLKGIAVGFIGYLVFYLIGIGLLRQIYPNIGDNIIYDSYTVIAVIGNVFFFARKKLYEGMGMLISLPLSVGLLFILILIVSTVANS